MIHPNIKTKVKHSESKDAWNIIGDSLGDKYKIARVPYQKFDDEALATQHKAKALEHALFISYCFNNPNLVTCQ